MQIAFLSLSDIGALKSHGIYHDLIRRFLQNGHKVYALCPVASKSEKEGTIIKENGITVIYVYTGKIMKTNIIEKAINTVLIAKRFKQAVKKYLSGVHFDLILYTTPPITLVDAIKYIKKRDNAKTYLMLKDIFPQNAVDLGMMSKIGPTGVIYQYFRGVEKKLYSISDKIGCMSPANVAYLLKHNPEIPTKKVEIFPNSLEVQNLSLTAAEKAVMRQKYHLPLDKKIFIYGGNLGKPQAIPFIIECLKKQNNFQEHFFLFVGNGTEYSTLERFIKKSNVPNVCLMESLPRDEYDRLIAACDVGLIFLDHRFTIPNFPSRLLSYMQAKLPILASTDPNTDIGKIIVSGGFGWWCESNDSDRFTRLVDDCLEADTVGMGKIGFEYLKKNYSVELSYKAIIAFMANEKQRSK